MIEHVTQVSCDRCRTVVETPYDPAPTKLPSNWSNWNTVTVKQPGAARYILCERCTEDAIAWLSTNPIKYCHTDTGAVSVPEESPFELGHIVGELDGPKLHAGPRDACQYEPCVSYREHKGVS